MITAQLVDYTDAVAVWRAPGQSLVDRKASCGIIMG